MRRRFRSALLLSAASLFAACQDRALEPSPTGPSFNAGRGTTQCEGTLPPGTYDNILVLPKGTCTMDHVVILRDVTVLPTGHLVMTNYDIRGAVLGHNSGQIIMQSGRVAENIRIKGGASPGTGASIHSTIVEGGDIEIEKMETGLIFVGFNQVPNGRIYVAENTTQFFLQVAFNTVGETVEVYRNSGPSPKTTDFNTAGVAVRCERNETPYLGGPNFAPSREGQCF